MKINFYKELEKKYEEIYLIHEANSILRWDQHVMLPLGGYSYRRDQNITLELLAHRKIRDKKLYNLIKKSERIKKLNIWEKKNLHLIKKHYTESSVLDDKLIEDKTRAELKFIADSFMRTKQAALADAKFRLEHDFFQDGNTRRSTLDVDA